MVERFHAGRVVRRLLGSTARGKRAVRRLATTGLTLAFLLNVAGPAIVLASPILAVNDAYSVAANGTLTVPAGTGVLANDDPTLTYTNLNSSPSHSSAFNLASDGGFSYTPVGDYVGSDSFTYEACTDSECLNPHLATVTISVGVPLAVDDSATVDEDSGSNSIDVMANDTHPSGAQLTITAYSQGAHGSVSTIGSGSEMTLDYQPAADFFGTDTVTYAVTDGTNISSDATVTITVDPVNDAPSFSAGDDITIAEDADDYSAEWATTIDPGPGEGDDVISFDVTNDNNALFDTAPAISADGTLTFSLAPNANGVSTVSATIRDNVSVNGGGGTGNTADFTVTVTSANDVPVCTGDTITLNEDGPTSGDLDTVCSDGDGESLSYAVATLGDPANGDLVLTGSDWIYTPGLNFNGTDSFTFVATDSQDATDSATIDLTVDAVNDAPTFALGENISVDEDAGAQTSDGFLTDPIAGPADEADQVLTIDVTNDNNDLFAAQPAIDLISGDLTFTAAANATGTANVSVTVSDDGDGANETTHAFTITISGVNDAPVAVADGYTATEDTALVVGGSLRLLANDTDAETTPVFSSNTAPTSGTLSTISADGSFTYTPALNFSGIVTFTYSVTDGQTVSNFATVTITVDAVNDLPVGSADFYAVAEGSSVTVIAEEGVLVNDTDAEDNTVSAVLVADAANGELDLNEDGSFDYTPDANFNGTDTFTYQPTDAASGNTVTVTITVTPVNSFPVAIDGTASTSEDVPVLIDLGLSSSDVETADADLYYAVFSSPTHGELSRSGQNWTYTPTADYSGTDTFTFYATDRGDPDNCGTVSETCIGSSSSQIKTITITIEAVNDAPVAVADSYNATEDTTLAVLAGSGVLVNDTDTENSILNAVIVANATHGTVTLNGSGAFSYVPTLNYNGSDSFTYKANDGTISGNTVTVTITISAVNDAPVAVNDSETVVEDSTTLLDVLVNDSDVDPNAIKVLYVGEAQHGTASVPVGGQSVRYVPDANYFGADTFDYTITDSNGGTSTATVTVNVTAVNDTPTCFIADTTVTVDEDGSLPLAFSCTDIEDTTIVYGIGTAPTNGSISALSTSAGTFTYSPNLNYNGLDSFTITGSDGVATSAPITVTVTVGAVNDAPLAVADGYAVNEEGTLTVATLAGVLSNDSDQENSAMTAVLVADVSHGVLTLAANGSFGYVPSADFNGSDTFTYKANDGTISGNTVTVTITVRPLNDAPVATDDGTSTNEDTAVAIDLGASASDVETSDGNLTYTIVANPAHGDLTGSGAGRTYTPDLNFQGIDTFTFSVTDRGDPDNCGEPVVDVCTNSLTSGTKTVTINVGEVNDAPVAVADSFSTDEDTTLAVDGGESGNILDNDSDVEDSTLTAVLVTDVSHGTLDLASDGTFTYAPTLDFNGTDSFTYQANDGALDSNIVTVTITVQPINDAPVVTGDSTTMGEDSPVEIGFGAASSDVETSDENLTYTVVDGPAHGALTGTGGGRTYTPDADFNGTDTFTFSVTDRGDPDNCGEPVVDVCTAALTSGTGTITIDVTAINDAPVAVADSYIISEDSSLDVSGEDGTVLDNDGDVENSDLTAALVTDVSHGTLDFNPDGTFTYAPAPDFFGTDSFTYRANDGDLDSNIVTVTITVDAVNDAPTAAADSYTTDEDALLTVSGEDGNVLENDGDIDSTTLSSVLVTDVSHGTLVLDPDGTFTYAPDLNFNGTDSFTYQVNDGSESETSTSNIVTVTITVNPLNDAPVAIDGTASTSEDNSVGIDLSDFASDVETSEGNLTYTIISSPSHGDLTVGLGAERTYSPTGDYSGTDTFTFSVTDRGDPDDCGEPIAEICTAALTSETKTITVTIDAVNDAPIAVGDGYRTNEDTTLVAAEDDTVLTNDSDVDGGSLTAVLVTDVSHGVLDLNTDGTFTYTPTLNVNGTDSFTYMANDGTESETSNSNVVTVTITVTAVNDAVIAVDDDLTVAEDVPTTLDVLANDIDVDLDVLRVQFVGSANHGLAYIPAGGLTIRYIPDLDYSGSDSFEYTVTDGHGTSSTATVTLTVNAVNDAPVAVADAYATNEDTALNVDGENRTILTNDNDIDSNALTAVLVTNVAHGTLVLDPNGTFTYAPALNFNGTDSFTYLANDGSESETASGNIVTVTITVNPVNDAPDASAGTASGSEDFAFTIDLGGSAADVETGDANLTYTIVAGPSHGELTGSGMTRTFTPTLHWSGTDSFTFEVTDRGDPDNCGELVENVCTAALTSEIQTITITVDAANDAPVAVADSYSTNEDATLVAYVLDNDTDVENDTLHVLFVGIADHGTAFIPVGGTLIHYAPDADYNGPDSFDYTVTDGHGGTSVATVTVNVAAVNDIPVCTTDETAVSLNEDDILALMFGCTDVDADTTIAYGIGTAPSHGEITQLVTANGTFTYVPAANYNGTDSFTVVGNDGVADSAPITFAVTVRPVNDSPVAVQDSFSTDEDTLLTVSGESGNVLDNDSDVEIDSHEADTDEAVLTAVLVTDVSHGVLDLATDGTFTYAPTLNFNGTDSFTYQANDGTESDSAYGNVVTVTITVNSINDAPVAVDYTYVTKEDTARSGNVLTNDTDVDHDSLTAVLVTDVSHGTLVFHANGIFTYTPELNFHGTDSFTTQANDGSLDSNVSTNTITVTAVNDAPVAVGYTYVTNEDTARSGNVLTNDFDVDADPMTAILVTNVSHGTLVLHANGIFTYTPALDFNGTDSFTYKANDGTVSGNTTTITFTITPVAG
jgi:VCBS repeat-containing protein